MNTTKSAQFTPGPWTLERDRAKSLSIYAGSAFVGEVYNEVDEPSAQENANAHLIAAAPAMYEALRSIPDHTLDCKHSYPHTLACWNCIVKAALAQAEGRQA